MPPKNKLKVLGEGSYGCVISHPLPCDNKETIITDKDKDKDTRKKVGKLFYDKYKYDNEVRFGKMTKKIDPSEEKILTPISGCSVDKKAFKQPDNVNVISKCELFTSIGSTDYNTESFNIDQLKNKKIWQITMPYGGTDIEKTLMNYKKHIPVRSFAKMITPLFEAIVLLKKNKMVHQDIKLDNVLVYKRKAILIDFSLMLPFSQIYTERNYKRLKRRYRPFPPEYYIASLAMKKEKYYNMRIEEIKNMDLTQQIIHRFESMQQYVYPYYTISEFIAASNHESLLSIALTDYKKFDNFADKIDVYSIGTTICELDQYLDNPHNNQDYVTLMRGILHPDPRYRMTPEDAVILCNKISSTKK